MTHAGFSVLLIDCSLFCLEDVVARARARRKRRAPAAALVVKIPNAMWPEGYEAGDDDDLIDDVSNRFVLCALHQGANAFTVAVLCIHSISLAKIIRERWKFWSGSVPANVSVSFKCIPTRLVHGSVRWKGSSASAGVTVVHQERR